MRSALRTTLPPGLAVLALGLLLPWGPGSAQETSPFDRAPLAPREPAPVSVLEVGQGWPSAPDLSPVGSLPPSLDDVRRHLEAGDTRRALRAAERFTAERKWGRERDAAWLVIGLIHREEGRHNLASEAFTKVRTAGGPLAPWGAWYEAEQDLQRGREWVAIRECERYRETWPDGAHAGACLRLVAQAYAQLGRFASAREAAAAYDAEHEGAEIGEQIELLLAKWLVEHDPASAIRPLQKLAVEHEAPLTGRVAEELLAELRAAGHEGAVVPDDTASLKTRAVSLREARRKDAAWEAFEELVRRSADDPELARWVEDAAEAFGWRTHRWDFLADLYLRRYQAHGAPADAWNHYRALDRGGRAAEAGAWALQAQKKHAQDRHWRGKEEVVARTLLLGGDYAAARDQLDRVAAGGGWTGRRAAFLAAFASFMARDWDDALARFDRIVATDKNQAVEARYWRARTREALEQLEAAQADRDWIVENHPWSWYAVLARQSDPGLPSAAPFARDGRWPGPPLPPPLELPRTRPELAVTPTPAAGWIAEPEVRAASSAFGRVSWPVGGLLAPLSEPPAATLVARTDELEPPRSYVPGPFFDRQAAGAALARFADAHADTWPRLQAVHDLARAGLYDLSGPLLSAIYEEWREARRQAGHPKHLAARRAHLEGEVWRNLFLFARDHHHTARFLYGLADEVDASLKTEALRIGYPLAHDRYVWTHAREHDVDPFLVMGLMRQESTYDAIAVSRVGARGAMQIMPRTGHLLADLAHDTRFTAGDLEDPVLSVGYGITYLGLLMRRFDGVYPLAIASYNGGPFNVSSWLRGTGPDVPMDAFVEMIPFRETRDYVKKVTSGYATYLALYTPEPTSIVLPPTPRGDHPEIVDF